MKSKGIMILVVFLIVTGITVTVIAREGKGVDLALIDACCPKPAETEGEDGLHIHADMAVGSAGVVCPVTGAGSLAGVGDSELAAASTDCTDDACKTACETKEKKTKKDCKDKTDCETECE